MLSVRRLWSCLVLAGLWLAMWLLASGIHHGSSASGPAQAAKLKVISSGIEVVPTIIRAEAPVGGQQSHQLTISNTGVSNTLHYTIATIPAGAQAGLVDWLALTRTLGSIPPQGQAAIGVIAVPRDYMEVSFPYWARLVVDSDATVEPVSQTVMVLLEVVGSPMRARPDSLSVELLIMQTDSLTVTLHNKSEESRVFALSVPRPDGPPWLTAFPSTATIAAGQSRIFSATCDASVVPAGPYSSSLVFEIRNPYQYAVTVPVQMDVAAWSVSLPAIFRSKP